MIVETQSKILENVHLIRDILKKSKTNKDLIRICGILLESLKLAEEDLKREAGFKELVDNVVKTKGSTDLSISQLTGFIRVFTELLKKIHLEKIEVEEVIKLAEKVIKDIKGMEGEKCYWMTLRILWTEFEFCVSKHLIDDLAYKLLRERKDIPKITDALFNKQRKEVFENMVYIFGVIFKAMCLYAKHYGILNKIHLPKRIILTKMPPLELGIRAIYHINKKTIVVFEIEDAGLDINLIKKYPTNFLKEYINFDKNQKMIAGLLYDLSRLNQSIAHEMIHHGQDKRIIHTSLKHLIDVLIDAVDEAEAGLIAAFLSGFKPNQVSFLREFIEIKEEFLITPSKAYIVESISRSKSGHNPFELLLIKKFIGETDPRKITTFLEKLREKLQIINSWIKENGERVIVEPKILVDYLNKQMFGDEGILIKPPGLNMSNYGIFYPKGLNDIILFYSPRGDVASFMKESASEEIKKLEELLKRSKNLELEYFVSILEDNIKRLREGRGVDLVISTKLMKKPALIGEKEGLLIVKEFLKSMHEHLSFVSPNSPDLKKVKKDLEIIKKLLGEISLEKIEEGIVLPTKTISLSDVSGVKPVSCYYMILGEILLAKSEFCVEKKMVDELSSKFNKTQAEVFEKIVYLFGAIFKMIYLNAKNFNILNKICLPDCIMVVSETINLPSAALYDPPTKTIASYFWREIIDKVIEYPIDNLKEYIKPNVSREQIEKLFSALKLYNLLETIGHEMTHASFTKTDYTSIPYVLPLFMAVDEAEAELISSFLIGYHVPNQNPSLKKEIKIEGLKYTRMVIAISPITTGHNPFKFLLIKKFINEKDPKTIIKFLETLKEEIKKISSDTKIEFYNNIKLYADFLNERILGKLLKDMADYGVFCLGERNPCFLYAPEGKVNSYLKEVAFYYEKTAKLKEKLQILLEKCTKIGFKYFTDIVDRTYMDGQISIHVGETEIFVFPKELAEEPNLIDKREGLLIVSRYLNNMRGSSDTIKKNKEFNHDLELLQKLLKKKPVETKEEHKTLKKEIDSLSKVMEGK